MLREKQRSYLARLALLQSLGVAHFRCILPYFYDGIKWEQTIGANHEESKILEQCYGIPARDTLTKSADLPDDLATQMALADIRLEELWGTRRFAYLPPELVIEYIRKHGKYDIHAFVDCVRLHEKRFYIVNAIMDAWSKIFAFAHHFELRLEPGQQRDWIVQELSSVCMPQGAGALLPLLALVGTHKIDAKSALVFLLKRLHKTSILLDAINLAFPDDMARVVHQCIHQTRAICVQEGDEHARCIEDLVKHLGAIGLSDSETHEVILALPFYLQQHSRQPRQRTTLIERLAPWFGLPSASTLPVYIAFIARMPIGMRVIEETLANPLVFRECLREAEMQPESNHDAYAEGLQIACETWSNHDRFVDKMHWIAQDIANVLGALGRQYPLDAVLKAAEHARRAQLHLGLKRTIALQIADISKTLAKNIKHDDDLAHMALIIADAWHSLSVECAPAVRARCAPA